MKWLKLEAATDEYDTTLGLKIAGTNYDGLMVDRGDNVSLIAHDIIEHQNGLSTIGPVWDEMEAMGGIWHCRGRWGDISGVHSAEYNVASDFIRMARQVLYYPEELGPVIKATREHHYDDSFSEIVRLTADGLRVEFDLEQRRQFNFELFYGQMLHRLRIGYRKCQRRFGERFQSSNQFRAISDEIAKTVKYLDYEGQRFRLGWGGGECRIVDVSTGEYW